MREIRDRAKVRRMVRFINALPQQWGAPWSGPPVGKVHFEFYNGKKFVSNFEVGPSFFGRNFGDFYSEAAIKAQIDELGSIVGCDLWSYLQAN